MSKLTPVQLHAIAVAAKAAKVVRDQLESGRGYRPEFAALFRGDLRVGADQPVTSSHKADPELLIAHLLGHFGPRKRVAIVDGLIEGFECGRVSAAQLEESQREQAARLIRETVIETKATRRGNVTGIITAELL